MIAQENYPQLWRRYLSITIDSIFIILISGLICKLAYGDLRPSDKEGQLRALFLFLSICFLYNPLLVRYAFTLGQYFTKIRVRSIEGGRLHLILAFLRFIIKATLGWISLIVVLFNIKNRAIHDYASGSIVVWEKCKG